MPITQLKNKFISQKANTSKANHQQIEKVTS